MSVLVGRSGGVTLDDFVRKYPAAPPRKAPENVDQTRLLGVAEGVIFISGQPLTTTLRLRPNAPDGRSATHLWVFIPEFVPAILERMPVSPPLTSGVAKHTKLSAAASCGGELWVDPVDPKLLYVNGGSGRYGPRSAQELADAVSVFEGLGYRVVSFGWSDEEGAVRVLRDV